MINVDNLLLGQTFFYVRFFIRANVFEILCLKVKNVNKGNYFCVNEKTQQTFIITKKLSAYLFYDFKDAKKLLLSIKRNPKMHKIKKEENILTIDSENKEKSLSEILDMELLLIGNNYLRAIVGATLDTCPKCIKTIPASSSGKYHPKADLGEGGLVRHIIAVTIIAGELINSNVFRDMCFDNKDINEETLRLYEDCAFASCLLHDCYKAKDDDEKHTTLFNHPILASDNFKKISKQVIMKNKDKINKKNMDFLKKAIPLVSGAIASHMGKWSTSKYDKETVLPEPSNGFENFIHMCDYIASRKLINFDFDEYYAHR